MLGHRFCIPRSNTQPTNMSSAMLHLSGSKLFNISLKVRPPRCLQAYQKSPASATPQGAQPPEGPSGPDRQRQEAQGPGPWREGEAHGTTNHLV